MSDFININHTPTDDWLSNIASKAKVEVSRVSEVLAAWRIQPSPVIASPRRLLLSQIEFSGVKKGVASEGPFAFSWDKLESGLWGVVTERNFKGKSSIIEIVEWLLRGRRSNNLQEDVWSWISKASLRFNLDGVNHLVEVNREAGFSGQLSRFDLDRPHVIARFDSEQEFENTMSDFFMRQFSMESVTNWQKPKGSDEYGKPVMHGWAALAGAMFIGTDYSSLIGDLPFLSGMPLRLMQMYLGLPWIPTLTASKAAVASVENKLKLNANRLASVNASRKVRIEEINVALALKRSELEKTARDEDVRNSLQERSAELSALRTNELQVEEKWRHGAASVKFAETAYAEDRHELQAFLDAQAAGAVFRTLDPSCCPRCEVAIGKERKKREETEHSCSVCNSPISSDSDGEHQRTELEERVAASKAAVAKANADLAATSVELADARKLAGEVDTLRQILAAKLATFGARAGIETEIAVLEARMTEASYNADGPNEPESDELAVLTAVVDETDRRMKAVQVGVLEKASKMILAFAQRFGMTNLTSVSLKGNLTLVLEKGGSSTSYSKVTKGEQLRLKVATALAMIHVGETEGVGRHPGLLMLDSPAAEELAPEDLEQLVSGLEAISKEFKHLQLFVAARATPVILNHIPVGHLRQAEGEDTLW